MTRFDQLQSLLTRTPLAWTSESDFPIEAAAVPFWRVWGWPVWGKDLGDNGYAFAEFITMNQAGPEWYGNPSWQCIVHQLVNNSTFRAYKRPTGRPSEYELYLLVRDGWGWVGVRTKLIET